MKTKLIYKTDDTRVYLQTEHLFCKKRCYAMFINHRFTKKGDTHNLCVIDTESEEEVLNYTSSKPFDYVKMAKDWINS